MSHLLFALVLIFLFLCSVRSLASVMVLLLHSHCHRPSHRRCCHRRLRRRRRRPLRALLLPPACVCFVLFGLVWFGLVWFGDGGLRDWFIGLVSVGFGGFPSLLSFCTFRPQLSSPPLSSALTWVAAASKPSSSSNIQSNIVRAADVAVGSVLFLLCFLVVCFWLVLSFLPCAQPRSLLSAYYLLHTQAHNIARSFGCASPSSSASSPASSVRSVVLACLLALVSFCFVLRLLVLLYRRPPHKSARRRPHKRASSSARAYAPFVPFVSLSCVRAFSQC